MEGLEINLIGCTGNEILDGSRAWFKFERLISGIIAIPPMLPFLNAAPLNQPPTIPGPVSTPRLPHQPRTHRTPPRPAPWYPTNNRDGRRGGCIRCRKAVAQSRGALDAHLHRAERHLPRRASPSHVPLPFLSAPPRHCTSP